MNRLLKIGGLLAGLLVLGASTGFGETSTAFSDSVRVQVSSSTVATLVSHNNLAQRTVICNNNTDATNDIIIMSDSSSYSTSSTTGTYRLQEGQCFSPDGPNAAYKGAIYGLTVPGVTTLTIDVLRTK